MDVSLVKKSQDNQPTSHQAATTFKNNLAKRNYKKSSVVEGNAMLIVVCRVLLSRTVRFWLMLKRLTNTVDCWQAG